MAFYTKFVSLQYNLYQKNFSCSWETTKFKYLCMKQQVVFFRLVPKLIVTKLIIDFPLCSTLCCKMAHLYVTNKIFTFLFYYSQTYISFHQILTSMCCNSSQFFVYRISMSKWKVYNSEGKSWKGKNSS